MTREPTDEMLEAVADAIEEADRTDHTNSLQGYRRRRALMAITAMRSSLPNPEGMTEAVAALTAELAEVRQKCMYWQERATQGNPEGRVTEAVAELVYDALPKQGLEQEKPYYSLTAIRTILNTYAALASIRVEPDEDAERLVQKLRRAPIGLHNTHEAVEACAEAADYIERISSRDDGLRIADFLIDQRDEPSIENTLDRLHYWRDKAIEAARRIRAQASDRHG